MQNQMHIWNNKGIYKMDTTMEIVYQEIQGLNFPSKITNKMITESGGLKQEGIIEIILENCSIE